MNKIYLLHESHMTATVFFFKYPKAVIIYSNYSNLRRTSAQDVFENWCAIEMVHRFLTVYNEL